MNWNIRNWRLPSLLAAMLLLAAVVVAGDDAKTNAKSNKSDKKSESQTAQSVEMFAAIQSGDITVKLIPKDSTKSRIIIENKTDKPLSVKLPDAFVGVPTVAAQNGIGGAGGGSGSRRGSGSGGSGGNQGVGGGGSGRPVGGGIMNVPPEKSKNFDVTTVCLDHGLAEPRSCVPYTIKPIEEYTKKEGVRELCVLLGSGKIDQRSAQAAAWHLNNDMTWEQLAAKKIHHLGGVGDKPYFTRTQLQTAEQAATLAVSEAKETAKTKKADTKSEGETPTSSLKTAQ
jgi:hypothetical protein